MAELPIKHSKISHEHKIIFGTEGGNGILIISVPFLTRSEIVEYIRLGINGSNYIIVIANRSDYSTYSSRTTDRGYILIHDGTNVKILEDDMFDSSAISDEDVVKDLLRKFDTYTPDEDPIIDMKPMEKYLDEMRGSIKPFTSESIYDDMLTVSRRDIERPAPTTLHTKVTSSLGMDYPFDEIKYRIAMSVAEEITKNFDKYVKVTSRSERGITTHEAQIDLFPRLEPS